MQRLFFIFDDYFVDMFTKEHFSFKLTLFIYSCYANNILVSLARDNFDLYDWF